MQIFLIQVLGLISIDVSFSFPKSKNKSKWTNSFVCNFGLIYDQIWLISAGKYSKQGCTLFGEHSIPF